MTTCAARQLVDLHFSGRIRPRQERALRAHLPDCARCHGRYERYLMLSQFDPSVDRAEDRLARGLGLLGVRRPSRASVYTTVAAAAAAAAAVALFTLRPRDPSFEFQPRGGAATPAERVTAYRVVTGQKPVRLSEVMSTRDELAFTCESPRDGERLLVFGVDEHRHVYWYHPAWTDPSANPTAVPIARGHHELPEAIGHSLDGTRLTLHAVFVTEATTVRDVEAALDRYSQQAAWRREVRVAP